MRQWSDNRIDQQLNERLGRKHQTDLDRFADQLLVPFVQLRIVAGILCSYQNIVPMSSGIVERSI